LADKKDMRYIKVVVTLVLLATVSLRGELISQGLHPNYDAQLPGGTVNISGLALAELNKQFPQFDFAFNGGLVGHFAYGRPGQLVIWAPPVQPLDTTPEEAADIDWRSSDRRPGYAGSLDAHTSSAIQIPQPRGGTSTISAPQQRGWSAWSGAALRSNSLDAAAIITGTNQTGSPDNPSAVPEPGSWLLVGCGLTVFFSCVRRRASARIVP
jgi:hypothetical protein